VSLFASGDVATFRSQWLAPAFGQASIPVPPAWDDDFLLGQIKSAEVTAAQRLGCKLEPTYVFPDPPTEDEITALEDMPWIVEPGYDFDPDFFKGERWGRIDTRQRPIISVDEVKWAYPTTMNAVYIVPADWLRLDRKYGVIQMVPAGAFAAAPLSVWVLSVLGGGQIVPFMVRVKYVCGLSDTRNAWPNVISLIYKMAVLTLLQQQFIPEGGSVSGDGLSVSRSFKVADKQAEIDVLIDGPKGSNGGLRVAIHGIISTFAGS
jgi:hypothetical protein